jgi:hypothetical protein
MDTLPASESVTATIDPANYTKETLDATGVHELRKLAPHFGIKGAKKFGAQQLRDMMIDIAIQRRSERVFEQQLSFEAAPTLVEEPSEDAEGEGEVPDLGPAQQTVTVHDEVEVKAEEPAQQKLPIAPPEGETPEPDAPVAKPAKASNGSKPAPVKKAGNNRKPQQYVRAPGKKYPWSNAALRLEEDVATANREVLKALLLGEGATTAKVAELAGVSEGTIYGRLSTQSQKGRVNSVAGGPDGKRVWKARNGIKPEAFADTLANLIK